jgi:predicted membrane metal-binding protein
MELFNKLAMRFFAFITLVSAFLLFISKPFSVQANPIKVEIPTLIKAKQRAFKDSFEYSQNANIAWAMLTGEKFGISPRVKADFKDLELGFLFSPSGLHLAAFLIPFYFLIKRIRNKKIAKILKLITFSWILFYMPFFSKSA